MQSLLHRLTLLLKGQGVSGLLSVTVVFFISMKTVCHSLIQSSLALAKSASSGCMQGGGIMQLGFNSWVCSVTLSRRVLPFFCSFCLLNSINFSEAQVQRKFEVQNSNLLSQVNIFLNNEKILMRKPKVVQSLPFSKTIILRLFSWLLSNTKAVLRNSFSF